jgi:hypothetical protein
MKGRLLKGVTLKMDKAKEEASKWLDPKTNKFPYDQLNGKFPEGVDPTRKEAYLNDQQFKEVLGVDINEFYNLKKWKQQEIRKAKGLF